MSADRPGRDTAASGGPAGRRGHRTGHEDLPATVCDVRSASSANRARSLETDAGPFADRVRETS